MSEIKFDSYQHPLTGEIVEYVIIEKGNGEYTSMLKSTWDELEAAKDKQSGTL